MLVDAHTCRPSELTEHDVTCEQNTTSSNCPCVNKNKLTADSCSASKKKSEKSVGHTRRNLSSDAVTANPSATRRSLILPSWSWNTRSSCRLP